MTPSVDRSGVQPGLAALLDEEDALGGPRLEHLSPLEARAAFGTAAPRWWGPVEAVGRVAEITVAGSGKPLRARVYAPLSGGPHPGVVFFHGGGWVIGDLDTHDGACRALCNRAQSVVVSVEYRKAPEHRFPVPLDDAWHAMRWVGDNATSLGIRPGRIMVAGDSAGANLAAVVAVRARDAGIELAGQVLVYPVTDCDLANESYRRYGEGFGLTGPAMQWFFDHYAGHHDPCQAEISPLRADDVSGLPPTYVATCEFDPLRDEGRRYALRLAEAGVPVVHRHLSDAIHGVFLMNTFTPVTSILIQDIAGYLTRRQPGHELQ